MPYDKFSIVVIFTIDKEINSFLHSNNHKTRSLKNFKRNLLNSIDIGSLYGYILSTGCILALVYANYVFCNLYPFSNIGVAYKIILFAGFFAPALFFIFRTTESILRAIDFCLAAIGLLFLSPVFAIIGILVKLNSKGPVFFKQQRVGKDDKDFFIYKFRTMRSDAQSYGALTVGSNDHRITSIGYYLRKYKLDELPQLINVVMGEMSLVGPRPEIRRYVDLYSAEQKKVLSVRPGITDFASIKYRNESEILKTAQNPEAFYIDEIMPEKIELSKFYIENRSISCYFNIIVKTFIGERELPRKLVQAGLKNNVIKHIHVLSPETFTATSIYTSVPEHGLQHAAVRV